MSRPIRIEYEGACYHVMNRGRGRAAVFRDEEYFQVFMETLSEATERFGIVVHAYCVMTDHYHLLISTPFGNLQRAMRHIGGIYTQRYNRLRGTDGALFRGRYKSILVDSNEYLLRLSKYIHSNPIDAKLIDDLEDYPWSSYPAYAGFRKPEPWLTQTEVYDQLSGKRLKAKRYRDYVENFDHDLEITRFYSKGRISPILGDRAFIKSIKMNNKDREVALVDRRLGTPTLDEVVDAVASYYKVPASSILRTKRGPGTKNFPRKVAMYVAQMKGQYRLTEIADHFNLGHYGSVASAVAAVKRELSKDKKVFNQINLISKRLNP